MNHFKKLPSKESCLFCFVYNLTHHIIRELNIIQSPIIRSCAKKTKKTKKTKRTKNTFFFIHARQFFTFQKKQIDKLPADEQSS